MNWFRVYDSIIDDPKILRLSAELRWYYVHVMAISSRQVVRGTVPTIEDVAIHLRLKPSRAATVLRKLVDAGLLDEDVDTKALTVHGWSSRQYQSDDVNARVKRFRAKSETFQKPRCNVSETAPDTDTDTETEQRACEQAPRAPARTPAREAPPEVIPIAPKPDPDWEPQPPPDEAMTGRAGRDHADFLRAVQILDSHATTRRLGQELRMHCDTPGVRMLQGWQLVCGAFAVQRPDRNRTWGTLTGFARSATQAEFDKLNIQAPPRLAAVASLPTKTDEELRAQTAEANRKMAEYQARKRAQS